MSNLILLVIALLFAPGILWATIDSKYSSEDKPSFSFFVAHSFLFGVITYVVLGIIYILSYIILGIFLYLVSGTWLNLDIINIGLSNFSEILDGMAVFHKYIDELIILIPISVVLSIPLAVFLAKYWLRKKYDDRLNFFFKKSGTISSGGRLNVWSQVHNNRKREYEYIRIIDYANGFAYEGFVILYSENEEIREVMLKKVTITGLKTNNETKNVWYELPYLFFSIPSSSEKIWIEFPPEEC